MAKDQGKPRFIRKNGRIIPIGGKGKSGDNRTKKKKPARDFSGARESARKVISAEDKQVKTESNLERRQRGFRAAGALPGLIAGGVLGSKSKLGAAGSLLGLVGGIAVGEAVGSRTRKTKRLERRSKRLGKSIIKNYRKGTKQAGSAFGNIYGDEFGKSVNKQRF